MIKELVLSRVAKSPKGGAKPRPWILSVRIAAAEHKASNDDHEIARFVDRPMAMLPMVAATQACQKHMMIDEIVIDAPLDDISKLVGLGLIPDDQLESVMRQVEQQIEERKNGS